MGEAWCRNVLDAIQKGDSVTLDKLLKSAGKQRLNLRIRSTTIDSSHQCIMQLVAINMKL